VGMPNWGLINFVLASLFFALAMKPACFLAAALLVAVPCPNPSDTHTQHSRSPLSFGHASSALRRLHVESCFRTGSASVAKLPRSVL
jgi:hypothetical protein